MQPLFCELGLVGGGGGAWGQALASNRAHNQFRNNGKRNSFSQNWSDNDAKRNRLQDFYDNFDLHVYM